MHSKVKSLDEIAAILEKKRAAGSRVVQCHGVFDLLHPGHIRHFHEAKTKGDTLVVTLTPDRFVNKGPGRPVFSETLRLESLAAIQDIDYVVLNDAPDAITAIEKVKPNVYVKGIEYANHGKDVTGKISEEVKAVEQGGGHVHYTDDLVFSSSLLLNQHFDTTPPEVSAFVAGLKQEISLEEILEKIESLKDLKVLIVGDAIIDEYQYVEPLGQTGKGNHSVAKCLDREVFLGGSLIIANHVAQFSDHVTLLSAIGKNCPHKTFIQDNLDPKVEQEFVFLEESTTLVKKRYVLKDGKTLSKLFETYSGQEIGVSSEQTGRVVEFIKKKSTFFDLVLVADFGNGFTNTPIVQALSATTSFLAVNTQTNSGNRGYNTITKYQRADYISLNEPELRLSMHDKSSEIEGLAVDVLEIMHAQGISVTRGIRGALCFSKQEGFISLPAFVSQSIDRIGAGDAYLSLSSLSLAGGIPLKFAGFLGALGAAMSVQMIGNQEPIKKAPLIKFLTRMLK